MTHVVINLSAAAEEDIGNIVQFIAQDDPRMAGRFHHDLDQCLDRLRAFPALGNATKHGNIELRSIRVSERFRRYLIHYRILGGERLRIIRIVHSARDVAKLL
ncbi:MAG: type II toxin-antitoxin system RelE/ParE family toxin [Rhizomicrobium sp.]